LLLSALHLLLLLQWRSQMPPHHPRGPSNRAPPHAASAAPYTLCMLPICYRPRCQEWGGVAHLCWLPQCSPVAATAVAAIPCEHLERRTCTRRRNGYWQRQTACSWRPTCAALSSAHATQWPIKVLLCASKMLGGVDECGCSGASSGGRSLPRTTTDPVPVSDGLLPQSAAFGACAHLQQQGESGKAAG
jgi:hypothetical protein